MVSLSTIGVRICRIERQMLSKKCALFSRIADGPKILCLEGCDLYEIYIEVGETEKKSSDD